MTSRCCSGRRRRVTGSCSCCSGTLLLHRTRLHLGALAVLPVAVAVGCIALAITETMVAKVRIYRAPRMLAVGVAVALLATAARSLGGIG